MTGIVSFHDIRLVVTEERVRDIVRAKEIATEDVLVVFPDENLNAAVERFTRKEIDELPVVRRDEPRKVIGMVSRKDVFSAYNSEVLKRATSH
jgi:CIC family chloride channel protein